MTSSDYKLIIIILVVYYFLAYAIVAAAPMSSLAATLILLRVCYVCAKHILHTMYKQEVSTATASINEMS